MTTIRQLLEFFEQSAKTQAAKGKRLEDFCEAFLRIDPVWSERFEAAWSWPDWPDRIVGHPDMGIDLVARERGTDVWASGIVNDVNQWGLEQGKPRYTLELIKQVVTLSLRTVEIVDALPKLRFDEHGTHIVRGAT